MTPASCIILKASLCHIYAKKQTNSLLGPNVLCNKVHEMQTSKPLMESETSLVIVNPQWPHLSLSKEVSIDFTLGIRCNPITLTNK